MLGTVVFSGMLGVTLFGIFLTPVFYFVIQWFKDWRSRSANGTLTVTLTPGAPVAVAYDGQPPHRPHPDDGNGAGDN